MLPTETAWYADQLERFFSIVLSSLQQEILPTVSEWAEQHRYMTSKVSNLTGRFSFENTPYAREIANCFDRNSSVREVAIMKGVQLGFTTAVFENAIGQSIAHEPCPMMLVSGDLKLLKDFKSIKLDSMIDHSGLREKILAETDNKHSRRTGDTAEMLDFIGGFLRIVGCHNANALRSLPVKKLFLDEIDAYPKNLKGEGNPIDLALARTTSYSRNRKIGYISTPLLSYSSNIKEYYEKGDQRKYLVPCPYCQREQELVFYSQDGGEYEGERAKPYGLIFNSEECKAGNYRSVVYRCKYCGKDIQEHQKRKMLLKGKWVATTVAQKPHYRSYHISALYSLFKPWEDCVADFLEAGKDPVKLQSFHNLVLGLPFTETTAGVELYKLRQLREEHRNNNTIPAEALFLVAACDVQDDRLEIEIKAFGDRYRSWGIDHRVIKGRTSDPLDECWEVLFKLKDEVFHNGMVIKLILVDSGDGEKTDLVYKFCERDDERVLMPLKGITGSILNNKKYNLKKLDNYSNLYLLEIYVSLYKNQISRYLNSEWRDNEDYPDGYMTFAKQYSEDYFRQLTTERKVKEKKADGTTIIRWEQHGRNEAFDLCVYCLCGAEFLINDLIQSQGFVNTREVFKYLKEEQQLPSET